MNKLLLVVDPQVDFINGSLPVPDAAEAMDKLAQYITEHDGDYVYKVCTTDWHPYFHCSFKENGGEWPIHCVQNSIGAAIWPSVLIAMNVTFGPFEVLRKGQDKNKDEYSIFMDDVSASRLKEIIESNAIDQIDICGIAGNICVLNTLKEGTEIYGSEMFNVLTEYTPSLDCGKALSEFINNCMK